MLSFILKKNVTSVPRCSYFGFFWLDLDKNCCYICKRRLHICLNAKLHIKQRNKQKKRIKEKTNKKKCRTKCYLNTWKSKRYVSYHAKIKIKEIRGLNWNWDQNCIILFLLDQNLKKKLLFYLKLVSSILSECKVLC